MRGYTLLFFLLLLLGPYFAISQSKVYPLKEFPSEFFFAYDSDQKPSIYTDSLHFHLTDKGFVSHRINQFFKDIEFENQKTQKDFSLLKNDFGQLNVLNGLGIVIRVDENGFTRLDKSSELRNNFSSVFFSHQNNLFSHGGYGYWNYHEYLVYFNEQIQEWKSYPINGSYIPEGRAYHYGLVTDNVFTFFGGQNQNGYLNGIERLDLLKNVYEQIGTISSDFKFPYVTLKPKINWSESQNLYYDPKLRKFALIDFENLRFKLTVDTIDLFDNIDRDYPIITANDSLYYITTVSKGHRNLIGISKERIENSMGEWQDLLSNWDQIKYYIFSGVFLVLFLFLLRIIFLLNKKSKLILKSVLLQDHYLNYHSEIIILEHEQSEILKHLIAKGEVEINSFSKLAVFEKLSKSYQKQIITKKIDTLIGVINENPEISKVIQIKIKKHKKDRRRKIVRLKGHIVIYNGWLDYLIKEFIG